MIERLFVPLEMRSCSFSVPEGEGGYGHLPDGSLAGADTLIPLAYAPAGGVHCNLEDWSRFVIAHLRGESDGSALLSAEAFRTLHRPAPGARYAFGWNVIDGPPRPPPAPRRQQRLLDGSRARGPRRGPGAPLRDQRR
jgi:CubicO group peptidase (beta-lactamase class C family)